MVLGKIYRVNVTRDFGTTAEFSTGVKDGDLLNPPSI
jgi:hypothetical protein